MSEETNGKTNSPVRPYVVLRQRDDDVENFQVVHRVESRNAPNALRKAFRELRNSEREAAVAEGREQIPVMAATLVVVPESMWRPTAVAARVREEISVTIGDEA